MTNKNIIMTSTYIVETIDNFNKYYTELKKNAINGYNQKVYTIGLDIEYICQDNYPISFFLSKNWTKDNSNKIAACLLQIASKNICLIINLTRIGKYLPNNLIKLLVSDSWIKLGIGIDNDLKILSQNYELGHCGGAFELKNIALMATHPRPSLENLYNQFVGGYIKKSNSVHDWTLELTDEQLNYSARDAIMSYQLGLNILKPSIEYINDKAIDDKLNLDIKNKITRLDNNINYIGRLQEYAQKNKYDLPIYIEDKNIESKYFVFNCYFDDKNTIGKALNKKKARTESAKLMYNYYI